MHHLSVIARGEERNTPIASQEREKGRGKMKKGKETEKYRRRRLEVKQNGERNEE
jgi:hypothetical protein